MLRKEKHVGWGGVPIGSSYIVFTLLGKVQQLLPTFLSLEKYHSVIASAASIYG